MLYQDPADELPMRKVLRSMEAKDRSQQEKAPGDDALSWLESRCEFRQPQQVKSLLRRYPVVLEALRDAYAALQRYFGLRPLLAAEVVTDPESEANGGSDALFVYIRTALAPNDALAALARFDEEWFLAQIDRTSGRLNFNLEFL